MTRVSLCACVHVCTQVCFNFQPLAQLVNQLVVGRPAQLTTEGNIVVRDQG